MKTQILIAGAVLAVLAGPAWAHAFLEHASPGAGASDATAPKAVDLAFSEALDPKASGVTVTDTAGHDMEAAQAEIQGASMRVALKPLKPGSYHVSWHAVSMDTHRTEGSYDFTVER
jgi:methionine-rich copper-binding protein CopC